MTRHHFYVAAMILSLVLGLAQSCAPADPGSISSDDKVIINDECAEGTEADTNTDGDETAAADDTADETADDAAASLNLLQEATYLGGIKAIMDAQCIGCHSAAGTNQPPLLSTFAEVSANAAAVKRTMVDDAVGTPTAMPPAGQRPQAELDLVTAWLDAGAPEGEAPGADDPAEDEEEEEDPAAADDPAAGDDPAADETAGDEEESDIEFEQECTTTGSSTDGTASGLLKPQAVALCNEQGFIYDRNNKVCSTASSTIDYECNYQGILEAFVGVSGTADILNQSVGDPNDPADTGEGFVIDQCGQYPNGSAQVFLVRVDEPTEEGGQASLRVRVLQTK